MTGKSPLKKKTTVRRQAEEQANGTNPEQDYVVLDKDLVRGLSEKEVEIEHLKDTVIALNQKVSVLTDME